MLHRYFFCLRSASALHPRRRTTRVCRNAGVLALLLVSFVADSTAQNFCEAGNTTASYTTDQTVTIAGTAGEAYDLTITAVGGSGGGNGRNDSTRRKGGSGATVEATFVVPGGTSLAVFIGQGGRSSTSGGGGGGTAVVANEATLLVLAGGGGGAGDWSNAGQGGSSAFIGPGGGGGGSVGGGGGGGGFGEGNNGASSLGGWAATLTGKGSGNGFGAAGGAGFGGGGGGSMGGGGGGGYQGGQGGSGGGFGGGSGGTSYAETAVYRLLSTPIATGGTTGGGTTGSDVAAYRDGDHGLVTLNCTEHVPSPEIAVTGNSTAITSGDTTPSFDDHTHFGSMLGSGTLSRIFTIENDGDALLIPVNVTVGGTHADDFMVSALPAASVAAGSGTTFTVTFSPTGSSIRTATISIASNDLDESLFSFTVQGVAVPTTPQIYWVDQEEDVMRRANRDGTDVGDVLTLPSNNAPQALAVDEQNGKVYWTDSNIDRIRRANIDGSEKEDVVTTGLSGPQDIELDVAGGKIYWVDRLGGTIKRANMAGVDDGVETLVSGLTNPEGLALDLINGRIYFTDAGLDVIRSIALNGSDSRDLVTTGLSVPYGIALDIAGNRMYWVDAGYGHLRWAHLDGQGGAVLLTGLNGPEGIALDVDGGFVYFTETGTNTIKRFSLATSAVETLVTGQGYAGDLELTTTMAALPVELVSFTATLDGTDVLLRWATASETNNAGFSVERLHATSLQWHALDFVAGHGTTTEARAYALAVSDLAPGVHRFRLKQVDYDGRFEYSPEIEVAVAVPGTVDFRIVGPNPIRGRAQLSLAVAQAQQVTVRVYDMLGREVALLFKGLLPAGEARLLPFDSAALSAGVYFIRAQGEHFRETQRVLLVK